MSQETKWKELKPFPHKYCSGCFLNGCYPWNSHPFLLCSLMGGMHLVIFKDSEDCSHRKPVDLDSWNAHMKDQVSEAKHLEECRLRAMNGKLLSSSLGPAEIAVEKRETGLPDTVEARLSVLISDLQKQFGIDQDTALLEVKVCVNSWAMMRGLTT